MAKKQSSEGTCLFQPYCITIQDQPEKATNSPAPAACSLSTNLTVVLLHPLVKRRLGIKLRITARSRYQLGKVARLAPSP
jgi:hypothetical protein